jgi:hypothetical protein
VADANLPERRFRFDHNFEPSSALKGGKGHLLVTFPLGGTYRVDVLKEPLNHPAVWMEFGPVIALADTVALKTWRPNSDKSRGEGPA